MLAAAEGLASPCCTLLQVESPLGDLEVAALDEDDLNAASIVLIRSFATSPDSVTVSLKDVG